MAGCKSESELQRIAISSFLSQAKETKSTAIFTSTPLSKNHLIINLLCPYITSNYKFISKFEQIVS